MPKIITTSQKETLALGKKLATTCYGGEVFALSGDLGAGKTCLTQGIARGLKIKNIVNSPTFVIMKIYNVSGHKNIKKFCHIDAYRLRTAADLEAIGALEYLSQPQTITVIEWAENVKKILPRTAKLIRLKHLAGDQRSINY